ncbi:hypothetical protein [Achromobacter sp. ACRQX]|uniref:hypothetical protein n=1 Tax=Achromobacter sp. ACRQX TaxID=2918181 RepID=UPI001EF1714C|nr:hypothetical protein [Achromobacter sp. ACRQX]MCG7326838.1 hypothetical protein [Achromobacter sp. ACRQX]
MKSVVFALVLGACSATAIADPVPAFAVSRSGRIAPFEPLTLKWDGTKLEIDLLKGGPPTTWEKPRASIFVMHKETGKDGRQLTDYAVGFRAQEETILAGTPRATTKERLASVQFIERTRDGWFTQADIVGGVILAASSRHLSDCVSTLKP